MRHHKFKRNKTAKTARGTTSLTKATQRNILNYSLNSIDSSQNSENSLNKSRDVTGSPDIFSSQSSSTVSMNDPVIKNAYFSFLDSQLASSTEESSSIINNVGEYVTDSEISKMSSSSQEECSPDNRTENKLKPTTNSSKSGDRDIVEQPLNDSQDIFKIPENRYKKLNHEADKSNIIPEKKTFLSTPLEQPLTRARKLQLLLEFRNVGVYVYCDNCNKVRYLDDLKDPTELPDLWYCKDNPDATQNTCEAPEVTISEEVNSMLILNQFNAGSLVWARSGSGYWWPGMVVDCPYVGQYFWMNDPNKIKPNWYNVLFFNESSSKGMWLKTRCIIPFKQGNPRDKLKRKVPNSLKESLQKAIMMAESAAKVSLIERLKNFCSVYVDMY